jgi:hypothetical protein
MGRWHEVLPYSTGGAPVVSPRYAYTYRNREVRVIEAHAVNDYSPLTHSGKAFRVRTRTMVRKGKPTACRCTRQTS